jgi:hypothetical protein
MIERIAAAIAASSVPSGKVTRHDVPNAGPPMTRTPAADAGNAPARNALPAPIRTLRLVSRMI